VALGDILCIDWDPETRKLTFEKEGEGAVLPVATPSVMAAGVDGARATGGRPIEAPPAIAAREVRVPAAAPMPPLPVPAPSGRRKHD
jgi:hypothetical protein